MEVPEVAALVEGLLAGLSELVVALWLLAAQGGGPWPWECSPELPGDADADVGVVGTEESSAGASVGGGAVATVVAGGLC